MAPFLQVSKEGVYIHIKVQPRAHRTEVAGIWERELKVKVSAPPVDSAANEALIRFLADHLGCAKNAVTLVRGQTSRHKVVLISGLTAEAIADRLA